VVATARGTFDGVIIEAARGSHGFGYDPLLFLPDAGCTSAELDPAEKNRRSHRGQAVRALVPKLLGRA
jgi:XTP/dITP diphosphohydrolase